MMKISKLLKVGAFALLAASLCFTSCKKEEDEESAIDGDKISLTNDSELNYRAFESLKTKHTSSTAVITINNPTTVKGDKANSVIGFVFGLEEVDTPNNSPSKGYQYQKDGSLKEINIKYYNFGVAGVRYNKSSSKLQWYVSYCTNVPNSIFGYNASGDFAGNNAKIITEINTDGSKKTEVNSPATETEIVKGSGEAFESLAYALNDGKVQVRVKVVAEAGKYKVTLQDSTGNQISGSTVASVNVEGLTTTTQKEIGRYVTVYAGETADAKMTFTDTVGNPIPVSEDDWVDLSK